MPRPRNRQRPNRVAMPLQAPPPLGDPWVYLYDRATRAALRCGLWVHSDLNRADPLWKVRCKTSGTVILLYRPHGRRIQFGRATRLASGFQDALILACLISGRPSPC